MQGCGRRNHGWGLCNGRPIVWNLRGGSVRGYMVSDRSVHCGGKQGCRVILQLGLQMSAMHRQPRWFDLFPHVRAQSVPAPGGVQSGRLWMFAVSRWPSAVRHRRLLLPHRRRNMLRERRELHLLPGRLDLLRRRRRVLW